MDSGHLRLRIFAYFQAHLSTPQDVEQFASAKTIVKECFPFVIEQA